LGQSDLAADQARRLSGERLLLGRSTHTVDEARRAGVEERADYIAVGAMYETETKTDRILAGPDLAAEVIALGLPVPVFAIGGIVLERVAELKARGVRRVAVSRAVLAQADPEEMTRRLVAALED
jgi:thiamine-phosphate pyrophosphorylase